MLQTSLTVVINCDAETLWAVLGDMVKRPERYEGQVTRKKVIHNADGKLTRSVERQGAVLNETIELHINALMVELTTENPQFTLIHQIVPSGSQTVLNLAATWEALDADGVTPETVDTRLQKLGDKLKEIAEQLASQER